MTGSPPRDKISARNNYLNIRGPGPLSRVSIYLGGLGGNQYARFSARRDLYKFLRGLGYRVNVARRPSYAQSVSLLIACADIDPRLIAAVPLRHVRRWALHTSRERSVMFKKELLRRELLSES